MIRTFDELLAAAKRDVLPTISVAIAQDKKVLQAIKLAEELGLARGMLVGNQSEIEGLAKEVGLNLSHHDIVHVEDKAEGCQVAIQLVREGVADVPMKGIVETSMILRAVLDTENGLKTGGLISHVGVFDIDGFDRLLILTDSAMNIAPSLEDKVKILENSLVVASALSIRIPKIAILCATETVNPKMEATLDAAELTRLNREEGYFGHSLVKGPLALDNAISSDSAKIKGITDPVAGKADILLVPDIEAGNILNKSLEYFSKAEKAGVIMGAREPIILTSRASSDMSKMHSIALALLIQEKRSLSQW